MSYTDPRKTVNFFGLTSAGAGTPDVQVEATAAILKPEGSGFIQDDDTTSGVPKATTVANSAIHCPAGATIESFGLTITEALTNGNATHCVVALKVVDLEGGTTTTVAAITVPKDSTEVTPASQTNPSSKTATQAVAIGARLVSSDSDLPYTVPQGGKFYVEVTQAAGAAGGAFRAWAVVREPGSPAPTSASPVTKIAS